LNQSYTIPVVRCIPVKLNCEGFRKREKAIRSNGQGQKAGPAEPAEPNPIWIQKDVVIVFSPTPGLDILAIISPQQYEVILPPLL